MLPSRHIIFGAVFCLLLKLAAPGISLFNLSLVFLASVLIDVDHYISAVVKKGRWNIREAVKYHIQDGKRRLNLHKKGKKEKEPFHLFHTLEFHLFIAILGFFWPFFFWIFIGMVFHSLLDVYTLTNQGTLYWREYFFFRWLARELSFV